MLVTLLASIFLHAIQNYLIFHQEQLYFSKIMKFDDYIRNTPVQKSYGRYDVMNSKATLVFNGRKIKFK